MLLLQDGLIGHLETQRVLQGLHQQQIATLQQQRAEKDTENPELKPSAAGWDSISAPWLFGCKTGWVVIHQTKQTVVENRSPYKYMCAVDKLLQPLLGDEEHFVKQEEGSLLLHSVNLEGTFQNQLSKASEVRAAPVHQQGLDFLRRADE